MAAAAAAPPPPQPQAFAVTKEVPLTADLLLVSWCPTMDLVVVVASDGQLHLRRMDWQLLWATSPEVAVTAICWRPDGRQLALGHANGALSVVDVESGEVVSEQQVHYAAITCLHWSEQQQQQSHPGQQSGRPQQQLLAPQHSMQPAARFKRLFAPPELAPLQISAADALPDPYAFTLLEAGGSAPWPREQGVLSLLCAGDARGRISLWLAGQVQLAEIAGGLPSSSSSAADGGDEGGMQQQQGVVEDGPYKLLHVVADSGLDSVLTISRSPAGGVALVAHTLAVLQQHQQPLQQCMALFSHLQSYLQAAAKCLASAHQDWSSLQSEFSKRFDSQLKQELADQGSSVTVPQQELLLLLATGSATPPLAAFLSSSLGEAGLRRLARGLDTAASGLHTALLERLGPLAELTLFLLGELRGAVAAAGGASWLGLQVDAVQALELQAAALPLRVEQLRRATTATACQYRAFFAWLLRVIRQLDGSSGSGSGGGQEGPEADTAAAALPLPQCREALTFLKGQFLADVIGPELSGAGLSPEAQARAEAQLYQGIQPAEAHQLLALLLPPTLAQLPALARNGSSSSSSPPAALVHEAAAACGRPLAAQLQHLQSLCESAFELPIMSISPCVQPVAMLQLLPPGAIPAVAATVTSPALASPSAGAPAAASRASAAAAAAVVAGPPLLQPKQCADAHTYAACLVPAAAAAAVPGGERLQQLQQQVLLVVRLKPGLGCGAADAGVLHAQAVLLQLQAGATAAAWEFYKDEQLAVLLHSSSNGARQQQQGVLSPTRPGGSSSSASSSSVLQLLDLSEAPWVDVRGRLLGQQQQQTVAAGSVLEQALAAGGLIAAAELPSRARTLQQTGHAGQLAVSRARGLGSLVTELQQLLLLDLEEDGEEEAGSDDMQQ